MKEEEPIIIQYPNKSQLGLRGRKRARTSTAPSTSPLIITFSNNQVYNGGSSGNGGLYNDDQVQYQTFSQLGENDVHFGSVSTLYAEALFFALMLWVGYLILPKGLRQYMCNAYPKRYMRSDPNREIFQLGARSSPREVMSRKIRSRAAFGYSDSNAGNYRNGGDFGRQPSFSHTRLRNVDGINGANHDIRNGMSSRINSGISSGRRNLTPAGSSDISSVGTGFNSKFSNGKNSNASSNGTWDPRSKSFHSFSNNQHSNEIISPFRSDEQEETIDFLTPGSNINKPAPLQPPSLIELESLASFSHTSPSPLKDGFSEPSPVHPNPYANHKVPSHMVLSSTLTSLRAPGIRLHAHGTQCEPRRIWIQLDVNKELIEWKTENKNDEDNKKGFTLGPKHVIALKDIIYIDVGKTTAALQLLSDDEVSSDLCFSMLTKNGSLDLNAANKLERDALISSLCLILDTIYLDNPSGKSWRDLQINDGSVSMSSRSTQEKSSGVGASSGGGSLSSGYYNSPNESSSGAPTVSTDVFSGIDSG